MTVICVIPARLNSSRFPRKLLAKIQEKTILQRSFENALLVPILDETYVATDNEEISQHILSLKGKILWTSEAPRDGTERICEALTRHEQLRHSSYIVNPQGDHPCISAETITRLVEALQEDPSAQLATAVTPIQSEEEFLSPHIVKCVFDQQQSALYFSRAPIPYGQWRSGYAHIGIYCYKTSFLLHLMQCGTTPLQQVENLEQLKTLELGYKIKVSVVDEPIIGIDTPKDLITLEKYLCKQNTFL